MFTASIYVQGKRKSAEKNCECILYILSMYSKGVSFKFWIGATHITEHCRQITELFIFL